MLGKGIEQLCVFAVFCALGVGLCALYLFAVGLTKSKIAAIVFDVIFGAGATYIVWKTNLEINNGECRAFVFIGLVAGALITYFTCKRTLDKLSAMLYNLFTKVNDDGTDILQEMDSSDIHSGNTGSGAASLHAVGNADADVVTKRPRRGIGKSHSRSATRRNKASTAAGVHEVQRLRKRMGRKERPHQ